MLRFCLVICAVLVLSITQVMAAAHSGSVAASQAAGKGVVAAISAAADPAACPMEAECEPEPTECVWSASTLMAIDPATAAQPPAPSLVKIRNPAFVASRSGIILPLDDRPPKVLSA